MSKTLDLIKYITIFTNKTDLSLCWSRGSDVLFSPIKRTNKNSYGDVPVKQLEKSGYKTPIC